VVAILFFIGREALPLFLPERGAAERSAPQPWGDRPLGAFIDERRERAAFLLPDGRIEVRRLPGGERVYETPLSLPPDVRVAAAVPAVDDSAWLLAGSDGIGRAVSLRFRPQEAEGEPLEIDAIAEVPLAAPGVAIRALAVARAEGRLALAAALADDTLRVHVKDPDEEAVRDELLPGAGSGITALALSGDTTLLVAGTAGGSLRRWSLSPAETPRLEEEVEASRERSAVGALAFLTGGRSFAAAAGRQVSIRSLVRDPQRPSGWRLSALHALPAAPAAITALAPALRHRGILAGDSAGNLTFYHATSHQKLAQVEPPAAASPASGALGGGAAIALVALAPRADGAVAVDGGGALRSARLEAPHPEVTVGTLFGKVWYEGYDSPEHVWQSTGSTDDFEPKLGLTPLVFGTLKGTVYALLFAVPAAILAALYTALFSHPRLRAAIKPTVELMAGLPSVVIGFLAGLWLAPLVERHLAGVLLSVVLVPALVLAATAAWGAAPAAARKRVPAGAELAALVPLAALSIFAALALGPLIEQWAFGGDLRAWIFQTLGLQYDQRNALVVGFAMGFAVIPIIFTISEDAISSVPERLLEGALALGASRWQAALRVVLPIASPAIFSAIMVGFGRAVGETMIVLMATGNTPVLDWSLFNGLRTLSANIAVEMPEAPHGGTLYRVLFVAAGLLFVITFVVNTAAEVVRMRLRERYARL
jgi:phosphate transport system permease protein